MGYLGATLTQVFTRSNGADVSLKDVTIARDGKRGYRVRMTPRAGSARRIWGIWRKSRVEARHWKRRLTFACSQKPWAVVTWDGGGWWKGRNREIVPLSPYVKKPLNSKVIKSFVPEQRSHYVFFEFRDLMFYVIYIWTLYVHFAYSCIWQWYITMSGNLAEIRGSVFISKSQRSLYVSFFRTNSELCIYHLFVWSYLNFLHSSQYITFPTHSCLVLYS